MRESRARSRGKGRFAEKRSKRAQKAAGRETRNDSYPSRLVEASGRCVAIGSSTRAQVSVGKKQGSAGTSMREPSESRTASNCARCGLYADFAASR